MLQRDENGLEKCVACFLCAAACPANCIYIEAAENTDKVRISGGERYAKVYNIDYNRCIFCGYCVEACPTDAITHGHGFEVASYNTSTLVYRKEADAREPSARRESSIPAQSGSCCRCRNEGGKNFSLALGFPSQTDHSQRALNYPSGTISTGLVVGAADPPGGSTLTATA